MAQNNYHRQQGYMQNYLANSFQLQNSPKHHHYILLFIILLLAITISFIFFKNYSAEATAKSAINAGDLPPPFPVKKTISPAASANGQNNANSLPPSLPG